MADDETIELDLESMTLGELEDMETLAGEAAFKNLLAGTTSARALLAVAVVIKRRTEPDFSMDDARNIKVMAFKQPEATVGKDEPAP